MICRAALRPHELPIQVFSREDERSGAAVGAVVGVVGQVSGGEEGVDFGGREGVAGFDGSLAAHHVQQLVEHVAAIGSFAVGEELRGQIADQVGWGDTAEHGWHAGYEDRAAAEGRKANADSFQGFDVFREGCGLRGGQVDRFRHEQVLRFDGSGEDFGSQLFVQHAFVQRVLVDDHDAIDAFGDEVAVVDLERGEVGGVAAVAGDFRGERFDGGFPRNGKRWVRWGGEVGVVE